GRGVPEVNTCRSRYRRPGGRPWDLRPEPGEEAAAGSSCGRHGGLPASPVQVGAPGRPTPSGGPRHSGCPPAPTAGRPDLLGRAPGQGYRPRRSRPVRCEATRIATSARTVPATVGRLTTEPATGARTSRAREARSWRAMVPSPTTRTPACGTSGAEPAMKTIPYSPPV